MTDISTLYSAVTVLIESVNYSFLLKNQFNALNSLLKELQGHIQTEKNESWIHIFPLTDLIRKLTFYIKLNFVIKERAPKHLPVLRKVRTLLNLTELVEEFNEHFKALEAIMREPNMRNKFSDKYFEKLFNEKDIAHREQLDAQKAVEKLLSINVAAVSKVIPSFQSFHNKFSEDMDTLATEIHSFSIFKRKHFNKMVAELDVALLRVNRNISYEYRGNAQTLTTRGRQKQKRLQTPITIKDLIISHERRNSLTGTFGDFFTAVYKPNFTDRQKRQRRENGQNPNLKVPALIQSVAETDVEKAKSEFLKLGYIIRQAEAVPKEIADRYCFLKIYGHLFNQVGDFIIVQEDYDVTLGDLVREREEGDFSAIEIFQVAVSIAKALSFLHENSQCHGDVRFRNIIIPAKGFEGNMKLAHFSRGVLKRSKTMLTREDIAFTAPETLSSDVVYPASDVYSLSLILWKLMHPESKPFDYSTADLEDIEHDVLGNVRPQFRYAEHCKKLSNRLRIPPEDWENISETLRFMWNTKPKDRASARLVFEFFKLQKESVNSTSRPPSMLVMTTRIDPSKLAETAVKEGMLLDHDGPAPPPRVRRSFHSSLPSDTYNADRQGSHFSQGRHSSQGKSSLPTNFVRYESKTTRKPRAPRVHSGKRGGDLKKKLDEERKLRELELAQPKHNSASLHNSRGQSTLSNIRGMVRGESPDDHYSRTSLTERRHEIGVDNLTREKVKQEIETYRRSLELDGVALDDFDTEEHIEFVMKQGIERFHFIMRLKYRKGLQMFRERDEREFGIGKTIAITEIPNVNRRSNNTNRDSKDVSRSSKNFIQESKETSNGLNNIVSHIKKNKRKPSLNVQTNQGLNNIVRHIKLKKNHRKSLPNKKPPVLSRLKSRLIRKPSRANFRRKSTAASTPDSEYE